MAETIKGLTVKIGADTSDFIKELKKVDKSINATTKQANYLQKGLELEFDEGRFVQSQRLVQQALSDTEDKVKAIRKQMEYLERTEGVDTDSYKKLQTELYKAETNAVMLKKKLEDINNVKTKSLSTQIGELASKIKGSTVAIATAVAGTVKVIKDSAQAGGLIQDMVDRFGISAKEIQRYNYIAMQSGVETEQLVKGLSKARDAIGTAMSGTVNNATKVLQTLFGDLNNIPKSAEQGFDAIVQKLAEVEDSTMQAYYANEIFGEKLATVLIPYINNSADKLSQLNGEFESLGNLSDEEIQKLADFDDVINNFNTKIKNLIYQLGVSLAPLLKSIFKIVEPFIPLLEAILDLITPIIDAISWIINNVTDTVLSIFGKGWLWDTKEDTKNVTNRNSYYNENSYNYDIPKTNNNMNTNNYEDNSTTNIEINADLTGELKYDSQELADSVIKEIVARKQAFGR